jgi:hypothetical protein
MRLIGTSLVLMAVAGMSGCSAVGGAETFTEAECKAFSARLMGMSGLKDNLYMEAAEVQEMETGMVAECMADKIGLSREQLECGIKSQTNDEFAACKIVIKG